jgi:hypothetical protein
MEKQKNSGLIFLLLALVSFKAFSKKPAKKSSVIVEPLVTNNPYLIKGGQIYDDLYKTEFTNNYGSDYLVTINADTGSDYNLILTTPDNIQIIGFAIYNDIIFK